MEISHETRIQQDGKHLHCTQQTEDVTCALPWHLANTRTQLCKLHYCFHEEQKQAADFKNSLVRVELQEGMRLFGFGGGLFPPLLKKAGGKE